MQDSFDILAADYRPMVLVYLRTLVKDPELAEDLTQETFLAAHKHLDRFRVGENFGAWLRGIARNKMKEHFRASSSRPLVIDSRILTGMEEVYATLDTSAQHSGPWADRLDTVQECIRRLSRNLQQAVEHVYNEGLSLREAAKTLGVSFEAMGQRLSRARVHIRQCVASRPGVNQ